MLLYGIHIITNSVWNKEELTGQYKEFIFVTFYKLGDKTVCRNYRSLL